MLNKIYFIFQGGKYPPDVVTHEQRQKIRDKARHFRVTSEFGRNYKCVDKYRGSFRIEDWLHFVCVFSFYIFTPGTLSPLLQSMWNDLQTTVMHYFGRELPWTEDNSRKAAQALLRYSSTLEAKGFPDSMHTLNLHISNCQLPFQEMQRGSASRCIELVVERAVGSFKSIIGRKTCRDPEKVYANSYLMTQALNKLAKQYPDMRSYEELSASTSSPKRVPPLWDSLDLGTKDPITLLTGLGVYLPKSERDLCKQAAKKFVTTNKPQGWNVNHIELAFKRNEGDQREKASGGVIMFKKAEINEEKYNSAKYMSPRRSRSNHYIIMEFEDDSGRRQKGMYVGEIQYFIKIRHLDTGSSIPPLRLPIIKFYRKPKEISSNLWLVENTSVFLKVHEAVDPHAIMGKVVVAVAGQNKMYAMRYNNLTSRD